MSLLNKKQRTKMYEEMTGEKSHETVPVPKPKPKPKPKPITPTLERVEANKEIARLADMMVELGKKIDLLIKKDEEVHEEIDKDAPKYDDDGKLIEEK
jgi:hypothetical protein